MGKRGRPPKFVTDPNGHPIVGFSYCKSSNRYYATYSKPRKWFLTDLASSLFEFKKYVAKSKKEESFVEIKVPPTTPNIPPSGETDWKDFPNESPVIPAAYAGESTYIPEILFLKTAREMILKDPIAAATKLGIPELSRLDDLPRLEEPLSLKEILDFYLQQRNPSKDEAKKMQYVWKEFCDSVNVKTIREITCDMVHDYKDKFWNEYKKRGLSTSWMKTRFTKVKTILNYSKKQGRTNKRELNRVLEWCQCFSVPTQIGEPPQPILKENVHKLLEKADTKWKAIMLLALNCGYYAKDIHDLKKDMIRQKDGLGYIVFPREKNKHMRVNVLWKETKETLDKYMSEKPNDLEYVFTSQYGSLLHPHDVQRCFDRLREKAGVSDEVKFSHFRDGAATALFGKVNSDMLKVTIGHRIVGEKSKYISVKPEQVKICADTIWQEYFGG